MSACGVREDIGNEGGQEARAERFGRDDQVPKIEGRSGVVCTARRWGSEARFAFSCNFKDICDLQAHCAVFKSENIRCGCCILYERLFL